MTMNEALIEPSENNIEVLYEEHAIFMDEPEVVAIADKLDALAIKSSTSGEADATRAYLHDLKRSQLLSAEQEKTYGKLALQGDQAAREMMIVSNLRLVAKISYRYQNKGLPLLDLIEEGNLGLIHAVEKFDPERGFRFSTYATWWIRQAIERAIMEQTRTIRLPVHVVKEMNTYIKAQRHLAQSLDHEPSAQEIADYMDKPVEKVEKMLQLNERVISVDVPNARTADKPLIESILDMEGLSHEERFSEDRMRQNITRCVFELPEKHREVICRRYGLCGYEETTLDQAAHAMNLTKERIRQIQMDGLKQLKGILQNQGISLESLFS